MQTIDTDFAAIRREIRHCLDGRTLDAVDNLVRVYGQWVARVESATPRRPELEAKAEAYLTECQRIAALMRDRGWEVYQRLQDTAAR